MFLLLQTPQRVSAQYKQVFGRSHLRRSVCTAVQPNTVIMQSKTQPKLSKRVLQTDSPVIVKTKKMMEGIDGILSLAQGVVYWPPPAEAMQKAQELLTDPLISSYGLGQGLPALREALRNKVANENGLHNYDVMVTAGANQAYVNVLLALTDAPDTVVLFTPYYFNHLMASQMTGGADHVELGPCHPDNFHPNLDWLETRMLQPSPPKMVVIVNPCNPTGALLAEDELQRAADICSTSDVYLVMDNTYEHFVYDADRKHHCISHPNVIHIFSFSKAYGMMGWRVGYIAYNKDDESDEEVYQIGKQLLKVQDTIPVCPSQLSQYIALESVKLGRQWVTDRVHTLENNRQFIADALNVTGGLVPSEGAIYSWCKLPDNCSDDETVVEWLVKKHKVCIIPGSSCGAPGYIRVAYANLSEEKCKQAAQRLQEGLTILMQQGIQVATRDLSL
eukprot:TRINITY_DN3141_c0_g4_i1.p1 TRINITY_DN3141_c0_g4~~TRINITY_DN3141_c0_g4_i1.p1  ORF type:complete len:447 (+),score=50.46 TRINITY_DN3141_c0_g4_i1:92-1432(+)